jgi:hypothetical protein
MNWMTRARARKRLVLAAVGVVMISAVAVQARPYEDGEAALAQGETTEGWRLMWEAAEQGDVRAQILIAHLALKAEDYNEAAEWFRKAAEQETAHPVVAHAQFQLGWLYDTGQGAPENHIEAVNWYRRAAERGHPSAQQNLGIMYFVGRGVPQDYVQAHMWLNLAAARHAAGTEEHDDAFEVREMVAREMTREQLAKAQQLAREWMPTRPAADSNPRP